MVSESHILLGEFPVPGAGQGVATLFHTSSLFTVGLSNPPEICFHEWNGNKFPFLSKELP